MDVQKEAGWRRGYAADCKCDQPSPQINDIGILSYADKPETPGERDNRPLITCTKTGRHWPCASYGQAQTMARHLGLKDWTWEGRNG
jgi:hypothetical protein